MNKLFEFKGEWEFEYQFDAFKGLQSRRGAYGGLDSNEKSTGVIQVTIKDLLNEDFNPTEEQINALNYLLQNGGKVKAALLNKLFDEYPSIEEDILAAVGEEELRDLVPEISTVEDCADIFGVGYIFIYPINKEGISYIGIEGGCGWEEEHGIGFMLHKDRVVAMGYADIALSDFEAKKDFDDYKPEPKSLLYKSKRIQPIIYKPHPKFRTLKPSQIDANKNYTLSLISNDLLEEFKETIDVEDLKNDEEKVRNYLNYAVSNSSDRILEYILKNTNQNLNGLGHRILHRGKISTIDVLIKFGFDINEPNQQGKTLLKSVIEHRERYKVYRNNGYIDYDEAMTRLNNLERDLRLRGSK